MKVADFVQRISNSLLTYMTFVYFTQVKTVFGYLRNNIVHIGCK